mgnify:CR=1 FL=1
MEVIFLIILVALLGVVSTILYLNLKSKPKNENKEAEEIANLKSEISNLKDTLNLNLILNVQYSEIKRVILD